MHASQRHAVHRYGPRWLALAVLVVLGWSAVAGQGKAYGAPAGRGAQDGTASDAGFAAQVEWAMNPAQGRNPEGSANPVAPAQATPNCPNGGLAPGARPDGQPDLPDAPCTVVKIHGNSYYDNDHNGRYDSNTGDTRMPNATVQLYDATSRQLMGQAVTNANGYYAFPDLPLGPTYTVILLPPQNCHPTTPLQVEVAPRDFSTYWCCSSRVDFGCAPGFVPTVPPPPPPGPPGNTPGKPPCCFIPTGRQIHLPILNYEANDNVCSSIIEVQNIGHWFTKALVVVWGAPGFCPPQCAGPLKVECSGLLRPGSTWNFIGAQLPSGAKSAMIFSAPAIDVCGTPCGTGGDVFADLLCESLFHSVVGNCGEFRRFKKAYNEYGVWQTGFYAFDFKAYPGASLAAEVVRKCPGDANPMMAVTGSYMGLADEMLGQYDPVYGGYAFFAPLIYAGYGGYNTFLYIQNGGYECSSIEIWFKAQDDCLRPKVCEVFTLAPGETFQFDAASCVGTNWVGSAWLRGSQPLSIVADLIGNDMLMTYHGTPGELKYSFQGEALFSTGSQVAYGPLIYSEYQGWDTIVQVQNLSHVTNAKVKVYFMDRSGDIITTVVDWICPAGSQSYHLPVLATLPGNWVGSIRVESQDWFAAGSPAVAAPNVAGVVAMVKYADAMRTAPLEAVAYDLVPEQHAFDWQLGSGHGGLYSGVGLIGIPSLMKDVGGTGLTTELAIANLVPKPGFTDFIIYLYDQNGLVDGYCQHLAAKQVEYIDAETNMAFLPKGFKGSAVISAVFWEHDVFDGVGHFARNLVGLAAVKLERTGTLLGSDIPGDESAANEGFPMIGPFGFSGPVINCPGVPQGLPCCAPGSGVPWPTPAPNPTPLPGGPPPGGPPPPPPFAVVP